MGKTPGCSMRYFMDERDRCWQVAVASGSYGVQVLVFSPDEGGEARKVLLTEGTAFEAAQTLLVLSEEELRRALAQSVRWDEGF